MSCPCAAISCAPPASWLQGESVEWTVPAGSHPPAEGWTMSSVLRSAGGLPLLVPGIVVEGDYVFILTPDQTAAMPAGTVAWQIAVQKGQEKHAVSAGRSTVCVNLATAPPDWTPQTPAERWLAALLAIGPAMLANGYASQEVDGMRAEFRSLDEYNRALSAARAQVLAEKDSGNPCESGSGAGARGNRRRILARFSAP